MKKISKTTWNRYKESAEGQEVIALFEKIKSPDSTAREFLGNFLCLVNQQLTRAACSKDTNEKQNVPKSFLCCFLGTKVQIFRETTKSS